MSNPKYYGYIYITTNTVTGKIYVGQKYVTNDKKHETYLGSGLHLIRSIKKHGREVFTNEVIEWCKTEDELNKREIYWIAYHKATEPSVGYNLSDGGSVPRLSGPRNYMYGRTHSPEVRKKISDKITGRKLSKEQRDNFSKQRRGAGNVKALKYIVYDCMKDEYFEVSYGKLLIEKYLDSNKTSLRDATSTGKKWFNNGYIVKRYIPNISFDENVTEMIEADFHIFESNPGTIVGIYKDGDFLGIEYKAIRGFNRCDIDYKKRGIASYVRYGYIQRKGFTIVRFSIDEYLDKMFEEDLIDIIKHKESTYRNKDYGLK